MTKKKKTQKISATDVVVTIWSDSDAYPYRTEINIDHLLKLIMNALNIRVEYHDKQPAYYTIEKREK